jgi:hypothetical protein
VSLKLNLRNLHIINFKVNFKAWKISWDAWIIIKPMLIIKKYSLQTHTQLINLSFREKINKCILAQTFQAWYSWDKN